MSPLPETRKRLLVVEDEQALMNTLCEELEEAGFTIDPAVTGEEALRKAQVNLPDGILLDLLLPGGVDGMGVLAQLKKGEQTRGTPVIILSNIGDDEKIREALDQGADAYFVKTRYSLQDLIERLQVLLQEKPSRPAPSMTL